MATKDFLLQGFTTKTHLDAVKRVLSCPDLSRAIISVAFVNKAGVGLLSDELAHLGSKIDIFAGIRNEITSREGLRALMEHGANVHYVDTGARHVIFHPKIYYASGSDIARMVIGSANFTPQGLNNNIEASIALDLDLTNNEDTALATSIDGGFSKLVAEYPKHIALLNSADELDRLHDAGRLIDEASSFPPRTVTSRSGSETDNLTRIKLKVSPLARSLKRSDIPKPLQTLATTAGASSTPAPSTTSTGAELEIVWRSKPLTERDLTIPSSAKTHATGSINLDKGLLDAEIDHRHFFRDEVFPVLSWKPKSATVEEAHARFGLIIKGVDHGEFKLRIGHTTSTNSKSYEQHNAMTRLSWGEMKPHIARPDFIGRTMSLYRNVKDPRKFVIEID